MNNPKVSMNNAKVPTNSEKFSRRTEFTDGLKSGIPIALGYFSVSFGVGILAVKCGLTAWIAAIISVSNLTSAGEVAGIGVIAASGTFLEMILTELLINCRYSLMALSLSQKLSEEFTLPHRILASYGITDEIFGVAAARKTKLTPWYMYGMILIATIGWVAGTYLGAVCGEIFPARLTAALGILLYGMFIAVIIPPIRTSKANLVCILLAAAVSCLIYFKLPQITSGFAIIISALVAAGIMAAVRPVEPEEGSDGAGDNSGKSESSGDEAGDNSGESESSGDRADDNFGKSESSGDEADESKNSVKGGPRS